jgi:Type I site-specific restriction-modification system, R (restriction) subunit and related helicases
LTRSRQERLPFRSTTSTRSSCPAHLADKQVSAIDTERALLAPERIGQVVGYIREHFDQKTKRSFAYTLAGKRLAGFNSLLATASIDAAKRYYASSRDSRPGCRRRSGSRSGSSSATP